MDEFVYDQTIFPRLVLALVLTTGQYVPRTPPRLQSLVGLLFDAMSEQEIQEILVPSHDDRKVFCCGNVSMYRRAPAGTVVQRLGRSILGGKEKRGDVIPEISTQRPTPIHPHPLPLPMYISYMSPSSAFKLQGTSHYPYETQNSVYDPGYRENSSAGDRKNIQSQSELEVIARGTPICPWSVSRAHIHTVFSPERQHQHSPTVIVSTLGESTPHHQ